MTASRVSICFALVAVLVLGACSDGSDNSDNSDGAGRNAVTTTTFSTADGRPPPATVTEALTRGRPVILAHAGGENAHPHSTAYGYADSVAAGVDILDFDVQLTKDGVLVVQHDPNVDRTTNGTGNVADMTYDQIRVLDNAYWFTESCTCRDQPESAYILRGMRTGARPPLPGYQPDDFSIPRFEDIARRFPGYVLNVEIKGGHPVAVPAAQELARILKELGRERSAVVTSFDDKVVDAFHEIAPEVEVTPGLAATAAYVQQNTLLATGRRILQVPPDYEGFEVLTPELVIRAHADGYVLWIWPNEREWENAAGYTKLLDMGVDGINAADPGVAVDVLKAWKR